MVSSDVPGGEGQKPRLAVTMDQDLLDWIDVQIKEKTFASRSHAIEFAVKQLMKKKKMHPEIG